MTNIYRVLSQSEPLTITKSDMTTTQKSTLVLQQLGGQYQPTYAASLLGNQVRFSPGDLIIASLRFTTHEYQMQHYQDVQAIEVHKIS